MRTVLIGLALCVTCFAEPTADVEVVVPPSAAHPQNWLRLQFRNNPKPDYRGKPAGSLGEFVAPEVISKIVVDQYAGPPEDVRRYLAAMPAATAQYFGPSLKLCKAPNPRYGWIVGARLEWTSTSTVTFESGRRGTLAVATVVVSRGNGPKEVFGLSDAPDCVGLDKVPIDSLYVSYVDPDGYSWAFAVPLQRNGLSAPSEVTNYAPRPEQLSTRDEAIKAALHYPAGLTAAKTFADVNAPFAADAYRFENGQLMAGPNCKFAPGCENISTQSLAIFNRLGEPQTRVIAVDERMGIVWLRMAWGVRERGGDQLTVWETFKVCDGKIHAVEAFMRILPVEKRNGGWE